MATGIDARPPVRSTVREPTPPPPRVPTRRRAHWRLRGSLLALAGFVASTAIYGAIFVAPSMPRAWPHDGLVAPFADWTFPALALGILVGGSALVAFSTVLVRPRLGALASVIAGVFMVVFEVVEILVVGFTPALHPDQPVAWLQVVYLTVGTATAVLGVRLWKAETGFYRLLWPRR